MGQQTWLLLLASCPCITAAFLGGVWGEKTALENNWCALGSDGNALGGEAQKRVWDRLFPSLCFLPSWFLCLFTSQPELGL